MGTVVRKHELVQIRARLKRDGMKVVFTNGCFDLLHFGHVEYLKKAKNVGNILVVGMNDDASVRRLKGSPRPITPQDDRASIIAALASVDYVCLFPEDTPLELITVLLPDVLVKGADWSVDAVVGKDIVEGSGGTVQTIEFLPDRSTTRIIAKIRESQ
jgi:D-beta-D-heptose 7-phosphate kinase/D-beta-D-heptose 1-phosphate adenosyltransferase